MADNAFDVVVLGGGPGGYVAAIRAAQLGLKTAVIEEKHMGGICLNWGCIPTKALLRSAEVFHLAKHAKDFGLKIDKVDFDLKKIVARSREVAGKLSGGIGHLMKKNGVEVINGRGKLNGAGKLKVDGFGDIEAKHIILATGARARVLPGLEPDGERILTYKEAMVIEKLPKSLLVVGSGAIGIEFASFYNTLGSNVTVIDFADRILPVEDSEISSMAQKSFEKQGIEIKTKTIVKEVEKSKNELEVTLDTDGKIDKIKVSHIISAVGIVPNSDDLGLESTIVQLDRNHIVTDEYCKTHEEGVYAIGDVASAPWLAHKASHEGIVCVEKIANLENVHPIDKTNIPGCTYCHPQIASVGLTEEAAKEQGIDVKIGRFPYMGNGKAIALGEEEGLIKTIFDKATGELIGAHLIGAEVTELISSFVIGKTMEATDLDFIHTIFPHPTLSEMIHESVLDADDRVVHM